jgi:hypothetical protein
MPDVWSKFDADSIVWLVIVVGVLIFSLFLVAAVHWHKVRESDNVTKLKLEMLDRGMSVDDIKTIIEAGRPPAAPAVITWRRRC